jgi:hypothetical protein
MVVEVDGILMLNVAFSETATSTPTLFRVVWCPWGLLDAQIFGKLFLKFFTVIEFSCENLDETGFCWMAAFAEAACTTVLFIRPRERL